MESVFKNKNVCLILKWLFLFASLSLILAQDTLTACNTGEMLCDKSSCIPNGKICNGIFDCSDRSDETFEICENITCSGSSFHCAYGACIALNKRCNRAKDCADNSDELNCNLEITQNTCVENSTYNDLDFIGKEWLIPCLNGECIRFDQKCDGTTDCSDNSDEIFQTCKDTICSQGTFRCSYGGCIDSNAVCDGKADCVDASDELQCDKKWDKPIKTCGDKFQCGTGICIDNELTCDGNRDCNDGSDETYQTCKNTLCPSSAIRCPYGACVSNFQSCIQISDCNYNSKFEGCLQNIPTSARPTRPPPATVLPPATSTTPLPATQKPFFVPVVPFNFAYCLLPKQPENGYYITSLNSTYTSNNTFAPVWTVLRYFCHENYILNSSSDARVCYSNGKWNQFLPQCWQTCPPLISNTLDIKCHLKQYTFPCKARVPVGTTASMRCRDSYELRNSISPPNFGASCKNGRWNQDPFECTAVCGTVVPKGEALVISGYKAYRGEFPWHVGIYQNFTVAMNQVCGGTIIAARYIISAAHCFWDFSYLKARDPDIYAVIAGKFYRKWYDPSDIHAQYRNVMGIKIPERFKAEANSYANDIALITLDHPFYFTALVRPICVDWSNQLHQTQLKNGTSGFVAGWGVTSEGGEAAEELQATSLPFIPYQKCYNEAPTDFRPFVTNDKICAGYKNGTSICTGDSGGGLTFRKNNYHFLQGVVSVAPIKAGSCDSKKYVAFTKMASHISWIRTVGLNRQKN